MGGGQHLIELLPHGDRLALVADDADIVIVGHQTKHLLGPKPKLGGFDGGALWIAEHSQDVVIALLGNQGLVALLWREGEDVLVEEVFKLCGTGEAIIAHIGIVKGVAQLGGGSGQLGILWARVGQCNDNLLLLLVLVLLQRLLVLVVMVVVVLMLVLVLLVLVMLVLLLVLLLLLLLLLLLVVVEQ
jgi:hypothetical protein